MENKKEEKFKVSVAQKALLYDEETKKFLLLKANNGSDYFIKHYGPWEIPGGKLEDNESLEKGLAREIKEETDGVKFEIICPLNTRRAEFDWGSLVFIDYLAKYKGGEITLSDEHSEYRWESAEDMKKNSEYKEWLCKLVKKAEEILESKKYLEGWKRCQADFENYKKRQEERQKELIAYSNQNIISEILPVLDNFHASTDHIPVSQKDDPWVVGIMHIQKQLEKVLEDNNAEEIKIKPGDKFSPETMEALENKECPPEKCKNVVKKIVIKGYKIGNRVIRAARVIVE
jgi:molecular chaperone GrpE